MERSPEDFVRKSIRHELRTLTSIVAGWEDLEEDGADADFGHISEFLKSTGSDAAGVIRETRSRYPLEENIRASASYIRGQLEEDAYQSETGRTHATEIVHLLDGAADLLSALNGEDPGTIQMQEVMAPFEDDVTDIDYRGHRNEAVSGNKGYWIPLNTLIGNAEDHAGPEADIYGEVREADDALVLTLWDDGPGIEAMDATYDTLDQLWEEGASSGDGGFGLYMAKTVFDTYGGGIDFDREMMEEDGVGCAYTIELPRKAYGT
ncbi:MAG: ATP-binding protein [Candidatus Nanohaloarchaea archaeon]|nr:ATP-binding protein [Candidatus Nanohaloarchaea archaeon]